MRAKAGILSCGIASTATQPSYVVISLVNGTFYTRAFVWPTRLERSVLNRAPRMFVENGGFGSLIKFKWRTLSPTLDPKYTPILFGVRTIGSISSSPISGLISADDFKPAGRAGRFILPGAILRATISLGGYGPYQWAPTKPFSIRI